MAAKTLRGASALALIVGASASAAFAQQTPQTTTTSQPATPAPQTAAPTQTAASQEATEGNKVTVTGSLIATAAEDAPKPVEVFTTEDLERQGSPSVSEFVRSLSVSYGDDLGFGQATAEVPTGAGFANANLRGLGSSGTLVLMNGKRTAAANGGFGADLNAVPIEALSAVEVLKDGASATYGAGAVGGVINFRTRRDIDAPQVSFEKRLYDGSDGSYKVDFLTGWVGDASNLLISLSTSHEDPMLQKDGKYTNLPFHINPTQWSLTAANPGRFVTTTNFLTGTPGFGTIVNDLRTGRQQSDCEAVGGRIANQIQTFSNTSAITNDACAFNQAYFQDLVSETNSNRIYAEYNADMSDTMEFSADLSYSKNETFFQQIPVAGPTNRSSEAAAFPALATTGPNLRCAGSCFYVIPVQVQTYGLNGVGTGVNTRNPFIDDFMTRTGTTMAAGDALYTALHYRPTLFGGIPLTKSGLRRERYNREQMIMNTSLKGSFSKDGIFGLLDGITYDYSAQYSQYKQENQNPDISVARLQNALLGYGGPNCNAIDRVVTNFVQPNRADFAAGSAGDLAFATATAVAAQQFNRTIGIQSDVAPGTGGCQWFNPFASAFSTSIANGAANPQFNPLQPVGTTAATRPTGYANSYELWDWMWVDKTTEDLYESGTFEAIFSGELPEAVQLPGGPISWALGSQWRMIERRSMLANDKLPNEETMALAECPYPDEAVVNTPAQPDQDTGNFGCAGTGAFYGSNRANITTRNVPAYSDSQNIAFYGQLDLPVLDNLNFTLNYRREDFNGGDLTGDIWSVAGKYNLTDNLYFRASYGTNYRAEAALDIDPGTIQLSNPTIGRFGTGFTRLESIAVQSNLGPEDDTTFNAGFGYEGEIGDGRFRFGVDFFEINITGALQTTPQATITNNVFGANTANCQADRSNTTACVNNVAGGEAVTGLAGALNNNVQFANCNSRLRQFIVFDNNNACVQGSTTSNNILEIKRNQINGPNFITNGIDYSFDFSYPLFDGTFGLQVAATQNLVYKQGGYSVNGVLFDTGGQRLGQSNLSTAGIASVSTEWKGNLALRWANDSHNVTLRGTYDHGTYDERYDAGQLTPIIADNPATGTTANPINETVYSRYGVDRNPTLTWDTTYIWTAPFWEELELRASVLNIFDTRPAPLQIRSGYYNGTADPRGRMFEFGVTKKF